MRVQHTEVYQFAELTDRAKERARDWYRDGALDHDWYEFIYDDAEQIGKLMGIEIDQKSYKTVGGGTGHSPAIYFSGFSSQGDGACFEGRYEYRKGALAAVKDHAPLDVELHAIAKSLQEVQRRHFYQLSADVKHYGHYMHEMCTHIDVRKDGDDFYHSYIRSDPHDGAELVEALRSFMRWIYRSLEAEHDYILSDESVDESITINEYEFTLEGDRA